MRPDTKARDTARAWNARVTSRQSGHIILLGAYIGNRKVTSMMARAESEFFRLKRTHCCEYALHWLSFKQQQGFFILVILNSMRKIHARRPAFGALVAWGIVAFYVLASARALVPGLCATQAAMDAAQCHVEAGETIVKRVSGSCCPVPVEDSAPGEEKAPVTPAESHCAFCNLLIAHTDPPFAFVMDTLPDAAYAAQVLLSFQVAQEAPFAAAPNRAPPV